MVDSILLNDYLLIPLIMVESSAPALSHVGVVYRQRKSRRRHRRRRHRLRLRRRYFRHRHRQGSLSGAGLSPFFASSRLLECLSS